MRSGVYARVEGGVVAEVVRVRQGEPGLEQRYHVDALAGFVPVPQAWSAAVEPGWLHDGAAFSPPAPVVRTGPRFIPAGTLRERMEAEGLWDAMAGLLVSLLPSRPGLVLKLLTLNEGVASDDPDARAMIAAVGGDPDRMLAP